MAWTPQHAHFAVIALIGSPAERAARAAAGFPPLVLLTGDDFADVLARRAVMFKLQPGCPLQVVWGLDGAPVTAVEYERLFFERAPSGETLLPPEQPGGPRIAVPRAAELGPVGPLRRLPPEQPRAVRPESCPAPKRREPYREVLFGEAPTPACPACRTRTRNLLVAEEIAPCDSLGSHAPNEAPAA